VLRLLEALEAFRNAIGTTQVAAVGDRQAEVFDAASETIDQAVMEAPKRYI
jgi:hypothetical protein